MHTGLRPIFVNLALFYLGWFACVIGAARGAGHAGAALATVIVAVHIGRSGERLRSLQLVLASLALGTIVDGGLGAAGIVSYSAADLPAPLPPSWILGLWGLFATTFDVALRWLDGRPGIAAMFGFVMGPPSYFAGQGLGALELSGRVEHLGLLGLTWGAALYVMALLSDRSHRVPGAPKVQGAET